MTKAGLPHPDSAGTFESGVIKELHLPDGGIAETESGKRVYFHRARVYLDTVHLATTANLAEELTPGTFRSETSTTKWKCCGVTSLPFSLKT